jgi:hypothetical protein
VGKGDRAERGPPGQRFLHERRHPRRLIILIVIIIVIATRWAEAARRV